MADKKHLAILEKGVDAWNEWRRQDLSLRRGGHPRVKPNLTKAGLIGANLRGIDFRWTNLDRASLMRANLAGADLTYATLSKAGLRQAELGRAALVYADLKKADLSRARLQNANFRGANLTLANLEAAFLSDTVLAQANLCDAHGLSKCNHFGPSVLDSRALGKSGPIPQEFLRGCGLDDLEIEFAKLYAEGISPSEITDIGYKLINLRSGAAVAIYSCFISYSSRDHAFAKRLYDDLQKGGVRCWFAPHDMQIGAEIRETIDQAIRLSDKLLLILSANSIQSEWVKDEVETAFEQEAEKGSTVLFPIRIDDEVFTVTTAWAKKLRRQRHIGDFSQWTSAAPYEEALNRLFRDLQSTKSMAESA